MFASYVNVDQQVSQGNNLTKKRNPPPEVDQAQGIAPMSGISGPEMHRGMVFWK